MTRAREIAFIALVVLTLSAAAPARANVRRPDLKVTAGAVQKSGDSVTGSFTVRNSGRRAAGRLPVTLALRGAGRAIVLQRVTVRGLGRSAARRVRVRAGVPASRPAGTFALVACADSHRQVRERFETNNCRRVGSLAIAPAPPPPPPRPAPPAPASSFPTHPVPFETDSVFTLDGPLTNYWIYVPATTTRHTALRGSCSSGRTAAAAQRGDIYTVAAASRRTYIAITVDGREGGCWDQDAATAEVSTTIADVKTHFNIDPRGVVLGGYSSGGDLSYRVAFTHSTEIAGVLAEDTSPFRDTGASPSPHH